MYRLGAAIAFAVVILLSVPPSSRAFQFDTSHLLSVNGNVYFNDTSHPASHTFVTLRTAEGEERTEQTTESGEFDFRQLSSGSYEVEVNVQGFERAIVPVDLSFGSSRGLSVVLRSHENAEDSVRPAAVSNHELSIPQKARDSMAVGKIKLYQQKDAVGAIHDFEHALAAAPDYYEAEYQIGMANLTLGNRYEASANFQKSIDMSSGKYGDAFVGLGTMKLNMKEYSAGEKLIRQGVELSPGSWLGYYELGRAEFYQRNLDDAKKAAEQARSLAPNAPVVYRLLANIHLSEKDYAATEADIDAYLNLDPDSVEGQHARKLREQIAQKIETKPGPQPILTQ